MSRKHPLRGLCRSLLHPVRGRALAFLFLLLSAASVTAQEAAIPSMEMEALAAYIGTWHAEERATPDGRSFHFVYELGWFDPTQTIIEMVITQRFDDGEDQLLWKGFKGWDPVSGRVYYHGFSPSGRAAAGHVEMDGSRLVTAYVGWSASGSPVEIRDVFSPVESGSFAATTLLRPSPDDEWREISSDLWRRVEGA